MTAIGDPHIQRPATSNSSFSELKISFESLLNSGAQQYDPVRFRFIEAMYTNAINHRESVRDLLKDKIIISIKDYNADYEAAKHEARQSLTTNSQLFPDDAQKLQTLFDQSRLSQLQTLSEALHHQEQEQFGPSSALSTLTEELTQLSPLEEGKDSPQIGFAFDDLLRQQETEALNTLAPMKKTVEQTTHATVTPEKLPELKSARAMRETFGKINADKLVTQMIKNGPENPGPLNPHKLVVRALTDMRDLSPHYLNRFISAIDTLLWLEQAEIKLESGRKKSKKR